VASQYGKLPESAISEAREKKRTIKPNIVLERSVQLSKSECWPKAQGEKRQDQNEEDSVFAPEATELIKA
jgi:hypothetical protein